MGDEKTRLANKKYRGTHRVFVGAQQQVYRLKQKAFISSLKLAPCVDCQKTYHPCQMDFDHVKGEKDYSVSKMRMANSAILNEIAKCDLVCANCHRLRTFLRELLKGAD